MKKILSLVVVAFIAMGHVHANGVDAKSPHGMSVVKSGQVVKLYYRGETAGKVKVAILNESGHPVFVETLYGTENFMRPYNFSALPEGTYTIELRDGKGKRTHKIRHSRTSKRRIAHLTRLSDRENKYVLSVPNEGKDALTVKIYDDRSALVYEKTEIIEGDFARIYNLNNISGNHTFQIIDQDGKINRLSKPLQK